MEDLSGRGLQGRWKRVSRPGVWEVIEGCCGQVAGDGGVMPGRAGFPTLPGRSMPPQDFPVIYFIFSFNSIYFFYLNEVKSLYFMGKYGFHWIIILF